MIRVKPQAIMGKRESKFAKALDHNRNPIAKGDHVKVVDGQFSVSNDFRMPAMI